MNPFIARLKSFALSLPATEEVFVAEWGHPTLRVNNKMFVAFGEDSPHFTVKVDKMHQQALLQQPGFEVPAYVGRYGWVSVDGAMVPWDEVEELVKESYCLIAPKKLASQVR